MKQLLNNFLSNFLGLAKQFLGNSQKINCLFKKDSLSLQRFMSKHQKLWTSNPQKSILQLSCPQ